jgi:hypothetical protein
MRQVPPNSVLPVFTPGGTGAVESGARIVLLNPFAIAARCLAALPACNTLASVEIGGAGSGGGGGGAAGADPPPKHMCGNLPDGFAATLAL